MGDKTYYFVIIFIMSCSRVLKFTAIGAKVEVFFGGGDGGDRYDRIVNMYFSKGNCCLSFINNFLTFVLKTTKKIVMYACCVHYK